MFKNDLKRIKLKRNNSTETKKDLSEPYNKFKEFEGQIYTGAKVGRGQRWYYKDGEWKEKKVAPDRWEFTYEVPKRRAGKAPSGSGASVGTEYHWYILAHQLVRKLDANNYSTSMSGLKYKIAHKRADKDTWNSSDRTQRKRLIKILTDLADRLEKENIE